MAKPVTKLRNRLRYAISTFEEETGQIVKGFNLIRLDQPVIHHGEKTDLVDTEIRIK